MPTARAPARVNLIGDHTDYQGGWCLPMAIDRFVTVEYRPRVDGRVAAVSDAVAGAVECAADGSDDLAAVEPAWGRTVVAVLRVLAERGRAAVGFDAAVASTVPVGSGLASSAAFEVALACAATDAAGFELAGSDLALAAQTSEHLASGVPCGVMDQMASVCGGVILLDCRSLAVEAVPLDAGAGIVVAHCGVPRRLADSAYAERRAACEAAARRLGLANLRDATLDAVADDPYARHVVSENARVLAFVAAMRTGDLARAGALMDESHASLRDDFAVSTPELDALVAALRNAGAYGARLTGAGFGGCAVALVPADRVADLTAVIATQYRAFAVRAADGARVL